MAGFSRSRGGRGTGGGAGAAGPRAAAALLLAAAGSAVPPLCLGDAQAQRPTAVAGQVLRRGARDTVPAPGARVVLHAVGRDRSGPLDSMPAGPGGRFRFGLVADTAVIYLISARWAGIEYFSEPLPGGSLATPVRISLLVSDTSSAAPIGVAGRFLIIGAPDASRNRTVVELFLLRNPGPFTRVGRDSLTASWRQVLPPGATARSVAPTGSEIAPEAVRFAGDTVLVLAPLAPGDRQLLLQYSFPASGGAIRIPLGDGADSVQVVTEEAEARVQGLPPAAAQLLDGRPFARWAGAPAGQREVVVAFPGASGSGPWLGALVGLVVAAGVVAVLLARRRAPVMSPPAAGQDPDALIDRIARLDTAWRQDPTAHPDYHVQRAALKARLEAALAARKRPR